MEVPTVRIRVALTPKEWEALQKLANVEIRPLGDQVRHILRKELESKGLLRESAEVGK